MREDGNDHFYRKMDWFSVCGDTNLAENFFLKPHRHRENIAFEIEKLMEFKN